MGEYTATVCWQRNGQNYIDNTYSRGHEWRFDGGAVVPASASPHVVPAPMSVAANVDPEEALVASLSSCHMLFFLSIAAKRRFIVDEYIDHAVGVMEENAEGAVAITRVTLRPRVTFSGDRQPGREQVEHIHDLSHQQCYIANSVKSEVITEPVW